MIKGGILSEKHNYLALDKKKVQRAKDAAMKQSSAKLEAKTESEPIEGIFFDGKKDKKTKALKFNPNTGRYHSGTNVEEHYTITWEPEGKYIHHFTPELPMGKEKPALKIAEGVHKCLKEHNDDDNLLLVSGDSTNTITGIWNGSIAHLERMLQHKVHWDICQIHTNELPLRELIVKLDGPYISKSGFSGPIGKLIEKVNHLEINFNFEPIRLEEPIIELTEEVINKMSTDQKNSYRKLKAVSSGNLPEDLAATKCGNICQSRWLTTGEALMMLLMSHHGLDGETYRILRVLVSFCVNVYFKLYFDIKVKHHLTYGPHHVVSSLQLLNKQIPEVKNIIKETVIRGAYHAHSESILTTLLCSNNKNDRKFAVKKILALRKGSNVGDLGVRVHKKPHIKLNATTPKNLITWKSYHEPVFTCKLSIEDLNKLIDYPLKIPNYSVHTQSCERAVSQVSAASKAVSGPQNRHGWVLARMYHREAMPVFESKKDILKLIERQ